MNRRRRMQCRVMTRKLRARNGATLAKIGGLPPGRVLVQWAAPPQCFSAVSRCGLTMDNSRRCQQAFLLPDEVRPTKRPLTPVQSSSFCPAPASDTVSRWLVTCGFPHPLSFRPRSGCPARPRLTLDAPIGNLAKLSCPRKRLESILAPELVHRLD